MRTIDNQWGNLSQGYEEAKRLEAKLHDEWGELVQEAKLSHLEHELTEWEIRKQRFEKRSPRAFQKYLKEVARWEEQIKEYNQALMIWRDYRDNLNRERMKLILWTFLGSILILLLTISLFGIPFVILPIIFLIKKHQKFRQLRLNCPQQPRPPKRPIPFDYEARLGPKPAPETIQSVSLEIIPKWWKALSIQEEPGRGYGMEGVTQLLDKLRSVLPDEYLAFQELLVTQHLDVDVMVIGPSGVWLLESKFWTGKVICHKGTWYQIREIYQPRGSPERKVTAFGIRPDDQWLREKSMVAETLRRRLPEYPWILKNLFGGLVFTHPDVQIDIDRSCKVKWGKPEEWSQIILNSKPVSLMTEEVCLKAAEVILLFASIVDSSQQRKSAVALSQQLYQETLKDVQAYVKKWVHNQTRKPSGRG